MAQSVIGHWCHLTFVLLGQRKAGTQWGSSRQTNQFSPQVSRKLIRLAKRSQLHRVLSLSLTVLIGPRPCRLPLTSTVDRSLFHRSCHLLTKLHKYLDTGKIATLQMQSNLRYVFSDSIWDFKFPLSQQRTYCGTFTVWPWKCLGHHHHRSFTQHILMECPLFETGSAPGSQSIHGKTS